MELPLHQNLFLLSIFLIIFNFSLVEASSSSTAFDIFPRNSTAGSTAQLDCTTDSSNDYYGFGVRLGVYFSWLSSYFANLLLPSEIAGSLDTNCIFLLALIASLFHGSHDKQILQIDALVIMQLCSGFLFTSFSIWGYRTSYYQKEGPSAIKRFGGVGTHCRLVLVAAISVYGVWFWWTGVRHGLITSDNPKCQKLYTWFFAKLWVLGGIDKVYIIMTIGCSIYYCSMFVTALLATFFNLFRAGWKSKMDFETGFSAWELKFLFNILRIFNIFWIIFCAVMIEMTLNYNHMLQVLEQYGHIGTPSQLLPLLVGTLSFVRVLWLIYAEGKERVKEASDTGHARFERRETETNPSLRNGYGLGLKFLKIFSPSARPHDAPVFELEEPALPPLLRPWHHRYLVALFPWLSTFRFWRLAEKNNGASVDIERSTPSDMKTEFPEDRKEVPSGSSG